MQSLDDGSPTTDPQDLWVSSAPGPVSMEVAQGVAHVRLARPDVSNAVDLRTARAFHDAVTTAAADPAVRVILVTGEGRRFCAGGDIASMLAAEDRAAYVQGACRPAG